MIVHGSHASRIRAMRCTFTRKKRNIVKSEPYVCKGRLGLNCVCDMQKNLVVIDCLAFGYFFTFSVLALGSAFGLIFFAFFFFGTVRFPLPSKVLVHPHLAHFAVRLL